MCLNLLASNAFLPGPSFQFFSSVERVTHWTKPSCRSCGPVLHDVCCMAHRQELSKGRKATYLILCLFLDYHGCARSMSELILIKMNKMSLFVHY